MHLEFTQDFLKNYHFLLPPAKVTSPPNIGTPQYPPVLNFFTPAPPPPSPQPFYFPLRLEIDASAFLTHGYFQEAHVHISEAIMTD